MRSTTDFAVLMESPNTSFGFAPKNLTVTSARPQLMTTLAITPKIKNSATSIHPHGTRKSSETPAWNCGGGGYPGKSCGWDAAGSMAGGGVSSGASSERALAGAAPDGL